MKTWLKGGLIGFIIGIIFALLIGKIPLIYPGPSLIEIMLEGLVKYIIPFTILGVFIGWLIDKFRK